VAILFYQSITDKQDAAMYTVTNPLNYLVWLGNPPNQQGTHTNSPPKSDLLVWLGLGAMALGSTLNAYGVYLSWINLNISHPREVRQKDSTFVFNCVKPNGERFYDCRTNYRYLPDIIKFTDGDPDATCHKLKAPYILDDGVKAYFCDGLYSPSPINLLGPTLTCVGFGFNIVGFYCNQKAKSIEEERQIALTVEPINSFIKDHFDELDSHNGMQMGAADVYVFLWGGSDCLTFEKFNEGGKDQVEWCLLKKGVSQKGTEYYLLQASSAKALSGKNPFTNLTLKPEDILRGPAVLDLFKLT
jgi:hypothetical protein